jgi:FkbM family methyltransferase
MTLAALPREDFRDILNEFRLDLKFRWVPFRAYYRLRALKYMRYIDPEMGLLRFLVDPKRISLDVGANLGLFTYHLARASREVHAFEPNPIPFRILAGVADKNVIVRQMAVTDRSGDVRLIVPKGRKGWSSNGAGLDRAASGRFVAVEVPGRRIDDLGLQDIGFIKIDVEGHEAAVLRGARETIMRDRPNLFIEAERAHVGDRVADVFHQLSDLGYDGYFLDEGVLRNISRFSSADRQSDRDAPAYVKNFIFIPR